MAKITEKQIEQLRDLSETFDYYQVAQICKGIQHGVDVSIYADSKYNDGQMRELCAGLISGIDVSVYANERIGGDKMRNIRIRLEQEMICKDDLGIKASFQRLLAVVERNKIGDYQKNKIGGYQ
ncbi:MAG: hypothetical protein KIB45_05790 [Negativicoccus succinicivorans]|uniref:hypothetical protein n=1 Tax=Negativicoccus succinicivorans TaxID=620903 RepID=UPI002357873A|nr:hypothetical protein [Negativicoccus succinicivorans]MBS5890574.1 hypothetical protein [Negativicoccus succinicivorans]